MTRVFLFTLLAAAGLSSQSFTERYSHLGTLWLPQFASAPFPHPLRADGHTYNKQHFPASVHYSDSSVALFVPKGFVPHRKTDLVIYFHGWNNNIDSACAQFRLIEQFCDAEKNAVFVFPEGPKNSPDSFGGRMEEKDGLKNLVNDVLRFLKERKTISHSEIGNIVLAGHSGAYRVISYCLMRGGLTKHISDVILFDALYGHTEKFSYWIDHAGGRFVNIYTNGGGTKNESENLMADLDGWNIPYRMIEDTLVTPKELAANKTIFIHTDLSHNEVIARKDQFRDILSTSSLRRRQ